MISEGPCDTETGVMAAENSINYILRYTEI